MVSSTLLTITISFIFTGFRQDAESTVLIDETSSKMVGIQNVEGSDGIHDNKMLEDNKRFVRKRILDTNNKGISEEAKVENDIQDLESSDLDSSWLVKSNLMWIIYVF